MALNLVNFDDLTRKFMAQEIKSDVTNGQVFHSKFLTQQGLQEWDGILLEAAKHHDSTWLAQQLRNERLAGASIRDVDRRGYIRTVNLQPENLADSEFNRYYIRGLCLRAIEQNISYIITYRAKDVRKPISPEGIRMNPQALLDDLRAHKGETALDVPSNPNSGICVKLP